MAKLTVQGMFWVRGSSIVVDGPIGPVQSVISEDGYAFEDPDSGKSKFLPKEQFEQRYQLAPVKAAPGLKYPSP